MEKISPSSLLRDYHCFDRDFWLDYKTLEKIMPKERFDYIRMSLLKAKRVNEKYFKEVDPLLFQTERDLLDLEWKLKSDEAKEAGTLIHELIRNLFCTNIVSVKTDLGVDTDTYKVTPQENFLKVDRGIFNELRLEIPLDDDVLLVGVIDCLIKDGNHLTLIDWKTSDVIKWKSIYEVGKKRSKRLKWPLSAFDDCNGVHYQIQLSIYAWMCLKLNPDFEIDCLRICQVKNNKKYKTWDVEYLKEDIDKLMALHLKHLRIKKEMEKCNQIIY